MSKNTDTVPATGINNKVFAAVMVLLIAAFGAVVFFMNSKLQEQQLKNNVLIAQLNGGDNKVSVTVTPSISVAVAQGVQGPQGKQGVPGPSGVPGATEKSGVSGYELA